MVRPTVEIPIREILFTPMLYPLRSTSLQPRPAETPVVLRLCNQTDDETPID